MLVRARALFFEAVQWHKNRRRDRAEKIGREGIKVEYVKPKYPGATCSKCNKPMQDHGVITGGHILCPDDWIMTEVWGGHRVVKPDIFAATFDPVEVKNEIPERLTHIRAHGMLPE